MFICVGRIVVSLWHSGAGLKNGRLRRFIHATFDVDGIKVIAADHLGGIYVFDLSKNRCGRLQQIS